MNPSIAPKVKALIDKGVRIPNPHTVCVDEGFDPNRISGDGVVIHTGCKIFGPKTLILKDAVIGSEGPVTVENCQIGPQVELKSGCFNNSVFLEKAIMGSGAYVREGTIVEEQAGGAHTVGLKQTILFPFVTLGSLINFCDCFMAGGTSREDHSEVGSSFIHFNYTPNQDKATPSLLGDVPHGVMLNQPPIFLGGQGGLVGPVRLAFGTVTAAGTIYRKDELRPHHLLFERGGRGGSVPFKPGQYRNTGRIITNNIIYIANLMALRQWYGQVRARFVSDAFPEPLLNGLKTNVDLAIEERIKRLNDFYHKLPEKDRPRPWNAVRATFDRMLDLEGDRHERDLFLEKIKINIDQHGSDYVTVIKKLKPEDAAIGTNWLTGIVDKVSTECSLE